MSVPVGERPEVTYRFGKDKSVNDSLIILKTTWYAESLFSSKISANISGVVDVGDKTRQ
jgi:hypothetical protein